MSTRTGAVVVSATLALLAGIGLAGCGGSEGEESEAPEASEKSTIPASLRAIESGAEDTIDYVLDGRRDQAIDAANSVNDAAHGDAAGDLAKAGIPEAKIEQLRTRAAELADVAAEGEPVAVALAANRVLALVPAFFGAYSDPVPPDVLRLDYLDFEIKLEALAGNRTKAAAAANSLEKTWNGLRDDIVDAGGENEARSFTNHVDTVRSLATSGSDQKIAEEAQHGLDLVDELERVYTH